MDELTQTLNQRSLAHLILTKVIRSVQSIECEGGETTHCYVQGLTAAYGL